MWWYADMTDGEGNGLVLVWAYGLPFLPGSREPQPAHARPALHLALYSAGAPVFYLLQQFSADEANIGHDGQGWMGACRFRLQEAAHHIQLTAHLNLEIPGSPHRLTGEIILNGPQTELPVLSGAAQHVWAPRCASAQGQATLTYDGDEHRLDGAAYFDTNLSRLPIHEQGIESWRWGRVSFSDETLVYYDVSSQAGGKTTLICSQERSGALRLIHAAPAFSRQRRGSFGLVGPRQIDIEAPHARYQFTLDDLVDDGPFYQRYLVYGKRTSHGPRRTNVASGHGVAELVYPARVDIPWQRPFVAMKTHFVGADNSLLLPFFTGFKHDRAHRMVQALMQSVGAS